MISAGLEGACLSPFSIISTMLLGKSPSFPSVLPLHQPSSSSSITCEGVRSGGQGVRGVGSDKVE